MSALDDDIIRVHGRMLQEDDVFYLSGKTSRAARRVQKLVGVHGVPFDQAFMQAFTDAYGKPQTKAERGAWFVAALMVSKGLERDKTPNYADADLRRLLDELGPIEDEWTDNRSQTALAQPTGQGD